jgi:hypothetical protein
MDDYPSYLTHGHEDAPIATEPRDAIQWIIPAGFDPPPEGGTCSVLTSDGEIWVGHVLGSLDSRSRNRVRMRLLGSGVHALFLDCSCQPLRAHTRADARQILERQRAYLPAAQLQKRKSKMQTEQQHDTDVDHEIPAAPEVVADPIALGCFRLDRQSLDTDFTPAPATEAV